MCLVPSYSSDFGELKRLDILHLNDVSVSEFLKDKKEVWQEENVKKEKLTYLTAVPTKFAYSLKIKNLEAV